MCWYCFERDSLIIGNDVSSSFKPKSDVFELENQLSGYITIAKNKSRLPLVKSLGEANFSGKCFGSVKNLESPITPNTRVLF